jgi:glycosyltransferase involved in cell wall biosynthesis
MTSRTRIPDDLPSPVTLCVPGPYPVSGGPIKSTRGFAHALQANVVSWVDPIAAEPDGTIWNDAVEVSCSRLPLARTLNLPVAGTAAAERQIARSRLVSVHGFWRWHIPWIHRVCRKHGVPYWFVPHGSLDPFVFQNNNTRIKKLFMAMSGRAFLRDAATIIYSTAREREKARPAVGHDRAAVAYWPLAAEDFAQPGPAVRQSVRQRLGIPPQAPVFLFLGRLVPMKRPTKTIDALAEADLKDAHMIVVGNDFGVTAEQCRAAATAHGLADRVHVTGPVYGAEKAALIAASDIYISLSARENFNFTAAEALAAGRMLILSPGNDLGPDIAGLDAVTVLADDEIETAAAAMRQAAGQPEAWRAAAGAQGADWARRHLSQDRFTEHVQRLARQHAKAPPPRT